MTLEATLDQSGNVADARVLSGPPELRKAALQSVLQWQFANGLAGETQQVTITFQQDLRAQAQRDVQRTLNQADATHVLENHVLAEETARIKESDQENNEQVLQAQLVQLKAMAAELQLRNRALSEQKSRIR